MGNYFNQLSLREKIEQLGKCRFMESEEFSEENSEENSEILSEEELNTLDHY